MAIFIYGLVCPVDGIVRYVGKSTKPDRRLRAHISGAVRKAYDHHTARWIRRLVSDGMRPELIILHEVRDGERWQDIERDFIASAADRGWRLTNSTAGGEGLDYIDPADEARYRANLRRAMDVYNATPEGKARLRRMVDSALEPDALARRNKAIRAAASRPEHKAKMTIVNREINARPEVKAKRSASGKRRWDDAEYRQAITAARNDPTFVAEQSERLKSRWRDPAAREKMNSARWTPERRREQAERIRKVNMRRAEKGQ